MTLREVAGRTDGGDAEDVGNGGIGDTAWRAQLGRCDGAMTARERSRRSHAVVVGHHTEALIESKTARHGIRNAAKVNDLDDVSVTGPGT